MDDRHISSKRVSLSTSMNIIMTKDVFGLENIGMSVLAF